KFKKEVSTKGGLYKTFNSQEELEKMLRINIPAILADYKTSSKTVQSNSIPIDEDDKNEEEDEIGFFELFEDSSTDMAELSICLKRIAQFTTDIGNKLDNSTKRLNSINNKPTALRETEIRLILDTLSIDLSNYSQRID